MFTVGLSINPDMSLNQKSGRRAVYGGVKRCFELIAFPQYFCFMAIGTLYVQNAFLR